MLFHLHSYTEDWGRHTHHCNDVCACIIAVMMQAVMMQAHTSIMCVPASSLQFTNFCVHFIDCH